MECRLTLISVIIITYLSFIDKVLCQNAAQGNVMVRENRDLSKPPGNPSPTDMFNSILSVAATNGVLPDLIPVLQGQQIVENVQRCPYQGQPIVENLQRCPYPQEILTKPLSVVPMPNSGIIQEPIIFSSQPIRPPGPNQNVIVATPFPCGPPCPSAVVQGIPQTISPQVLPPPNCVSQIAQALPLENYSACPQNGGGVRPMPIVLQPQCQFNEVNPYNFYNQITEPILLPEVNVNSLNLPIFSSPQMLPPINTGSGTLEITPNIGSSCIPQPIFTNDGQQLPLSLQINVPTPSAPAPRITVVSANPSNSPVPSTPPICPPSFFPTPVCPDYPANFPTIQYPPQPPIILGGNSKSSLQNWLPIILVALFSDRGCSNVGCGCCRCCCSCNGGSGNTIPIPYPIPIPVNNPIINSCPYPYSSRSREIRDYGDDDEDYKRK